VRADAARSAGWDAALYGASALIAGVAARWDHIPLQRQWGRLAVGPYAAGALAALLLAACWRARPPRTPLVARTAVALAVLAGALAVPLALEVAWRARDGDRFHIQSEVFLVEQGAGVLLDGGNPYARSYGYGVLRTYPPGVWQHIPYLPGIFAFGLPRALAGPGPPTDARVGFALAAVSAALLALARSGASGAQRLRVLTVLLVLPTGARYLTGGGDDVAVLALLLLAVVLERRGRPVLAGLVAGLAGAIKQTALVPLPFLALAARDRTGRRAAGRFAAAAAAVVVPVVAPFALRDARALVDSVVLFPLGLAEAPTIARGPTVGQLLTAPFPQARGILAAALASVVAAIAVALLLRRGPWSVKAAARRGAVVLAAAILLAPAGRLGYLIYPLNLLLWSRLPDGDAEPRAAPDGGPDQAGESPAAPAGSAATTRRAGPARE